MRAVLPLTFILAGCASVGDGKVQYLKPGMTMAPVSVMGDTLALRQIGDRASLNRERQIDVASWRIDRHAESVAGRVLGDAGKLSVAAADTAELRKSVRLHAVNFLAMKVIVLDARSGESAARAQCALGAPRQDGDDTRAGIEQLFEGALRKCLGGLKLG